MELATVANANANEGKNKSVVCSCSSEANTEASVTCLRANTAQDSAPQFCLHREAMRLHLFFFFPFVWPEEDRQALR